MGFQIADEAGDTTRPDLWFIWEGSKLLQLDGGFPDTPAGMALTGQHFAGIADGRRCLSAELVGAAPAGSQWVGMRDALAQMDLSQQQALSRARQLHLFEREHRFCGSCATPLTDNGHDSGKCCPSCGALYYPRLSPAMMALVVRGREILLARSPRFAEGVYSALAGFVEPGETLEQCVHREVMEEVGVQVGNLRYVGSQSWAFPHSLMLAFVADYAGGEIVPQEGEIADARWFDIDRLPALPARSSIAWRLIRHTVEQLGNPA